jgi:hypothetical protein
MTTEKQFIAKAKQWLASPSLMVRELFGVKPDPWQEEILEAFPKNEYLAMQACKGPGKTAVMAWLAWNFLLTRPNPKIAATSISGDNLKDNLWAEMALWQSKSPMLMQLFEWTNTRIFLKSKPEIWWMSARTWPKTGDANAQANTLAGLHADYILFLLDESGGIPDAVMVSAEAALSSCKEGHIVQAGNPTHLQGPLFRASRDRKENGGLWYVVEITGDPDDPKRSPRVKVDWARNQIKKYGRDNPWVMVNVFGKFPPASINTLISEDEVRASMRRAYRDYEYKDYAKVMGVDVARMGDDASVIARRQGIQMFNLIKRRNVPDGIQGAALTNRIWGEFKADACFIDATGGFGYTWIDQLTVLSRSPIPVQFAGKASQAERYANKRAEMYFDLVDWIRAGGALPPEDSEGATELLKALCETTYTFSKDKMLLEDKDALKDRIGYSPDEADACALTFAEPINPVKRVLTATQRSAIASNYDAFGEMGSTAPPGMYDPFRSP